MSDDLHDEPPSNWLALAAGLCAISTLIFAMLWIGRELYRHRWEIWITVKDADPLVAGFIFFTFGFVACLVIAIRKP